MARGAIDRYILLTGREKVYVPSAGKIAGNVQRKTTSPCKDCKDRNLACHSTCAAYNEYKRGLESEKEKIKRAYEGERVFQDFVINGRKKQLNVKAELKLDI